MPNRTLYVSEKHEPIWTQAEAMAADAGVSLSGVVTRALREFIERAETGPVDVQTLTERFQALEGWARTRGWQPPTAKRSGDSVSPE